MFDEEVLRSVMMTCIILHNVIMEDEYDYDALEVFELDSMNTALTRIYERSMGSHGQPMEYELLYHCWMYALCWPLPPFFQYASTPFGLVSLDSSAKPKAKPMELNHGVASRSTQQADPLE
ncbi:unnamed protein product [Prunus brigantina]